METVWETLVWKILNISLYGRICRWRHIR